VAHHSVLIVEVFGAIEKIRPGEFLKYGDNEHPLVRELLDIRKTSASSTSWRPITTRWNAATTRSTCSRWA
jgi:arginine decarboxylase-like protein